MWFLADPCVDFPFTQRDDLPTFIGWEIHQLQLAGRCGYGQTDVVRERLKRE